MNNNYIAYTTADDFYAGTLELTRLGMKFVAHFDELRIELTGGY